MQVPDETLSLNPKAALKNYAAEIGLNLDNKLTFYQFRFLLLKTFDDYLKKQTSLKAFYQIVFLLHSVDRINRSTQNPEDPQPDLIVKCLAEESSYNSVLEHQPTMELVTQTRLFSEDYPYDEAMLQALNFYKKYRTVFKDNYNRFLKLNEPFLNPFRAFQAYIDEYNINIETELTYDQFRFLFMKLMDDYLKRKLSLGDFFQFLMQLDGYRFDDIKAEDLLRPDEIIMYLSEISSFQEILEHQPTLELVEGKTNITDVDYPYDWPLREALKYYKNNRHILQIQ